MKRYLTFIFLSLITTNFIYAQLWPKLSWYKTYNGQGDGVDIVQDVKFHNLDIYLAGRSSGADTSQDLLILKYSDTGDSLLGIRYSANLHSWDEATSIAIDSQQNIYAVGSSTFEQNTFYALFQKYSSQGKLIFAKYFNSNLDINSEGNFVTLNSNEEPVIGYTQWNKGQSAIIRKYSSLGDSIWAVTFADDTSSYSVEYLITDQNNNIFALISQGYWDGGDVGSVDAVVAKISKDGNVLWKSSVKRCTPQKFILDKEENIVLITNNDGRTVKLDNEGKVLWVDDYTNSKHPITVLTGLVIDSDNNIVVSGYEPGNNSWDYRTKKFSPAGDEIWYNDFESPEGLNDFALDLAADSDDNLYVTGTTHNQVSVGFSYTVTYSKDGTPGWVYKFDPPNSTFENAMKLFIGDSNNVYIGGDTGEPGFGPDFLAFKIGYGIGLGVEKSGNDIPDKFYLSQNYPNPFNPTTTIKYSIPSVETSHASSVRLIVYDLLGREVASLVNEEKPAGNYEVKWNAANLPSGIYMYKINAGNYTAVKKMILLK